MAPVVISQTDYLSPKAIKVQDKQSKQCSKHTLSTTIIIIRKTYHIKKLIPWICFNTSCSSLLLLLLCERCEAYHHCNPRKGKKNQQKDTRASRRTRNSHSHFSLWEWAHSGFRSCNEDMFRVIYPMLMKQNTKLKNCAYLCSLV